MSAGCQPTSTPAPAPEILSANCQKLANFDPANAESDAKQQIKDGRRYLLGVYGYAATIPGGAAEGLQAKMIEGTSDYECHQLNQRTTEYALKFNAIMRVNQSVQ
jgi:hypothetical protein